jgi:hypothetical protein
MAQSSARSSHSVPALAKLGRGTPICGWGGPHAKYTLDESCATGVQWPLRAKHLELPTAADVRNGGLC